MIKKLIYGALTVAMLASCAPAQSSSLRSCTNSNLESAVSFSLAAIGTVEKPLWDLWMTEDGSYCKASEFSAEIYGYINLKSGDGRHETAEYGDFSQITLKGNDNEVKYKMIYEGNGLYSIYDKKDKKVAHLQLRTFFADELKNLDDEVIAEFTTSSEEYTLYNVKVKKSDNFTNMDLATIAALINAYDALLH
jgi:hypothetical protein